MTSPDIRFVFVRHGEAEYNVLNRVNGNPAVANNLTKRGREQARQCALQLAAEPFDVVYCSEFPRARQTAEIAGESYPIPLRIDRRINETGAFAFEGQDCSAWHNALIPDRFRAEPPGCEAFGPFKARLADFLIDTFHRQESRLLVVSHEEPIQIMLGILEGLPAAQARMRPIPHCVAIPWEGSRQAVREIAWTGGSI